jgi:hypothetical protein
MSMRRGIHTSRNASIRPITGGADDPDQLVGVAAGELLEWAWLIADLADWLEHVDTPTRYEFAEYFNGYRHADTAAWMATHIAERIAALLDGDRGQP